MSILRAFLETTGEELIGDSIHIDATKFEVTAPREITATPSSPWQSVEALRQEMDRVLMPVAARLLYRQLRGVALYCSAAEELNGQRVRIGGFDLNLGDNRNWVGFRPQDAPVNDLVAARDVVLSDELAMPRGDAADTTLLYMLEHLLRAIVYPKYAMVHAYKLFEVARVAVGGDWALLGVACSAVKRLTQAANDGHDERHAPGQLEPISALSEAERRAHLETARQMVSGYSLLRVQAARGSPSRSPLG